MMTSDKVPSRAAWANAVSWYTVRATSPRSRGSLDARLFCSSVDLVDDVTGAVADVRTIVGRDASPGVLLAAAYHASSDVLPRNRRRRLHFSPGGFAFPADASRYSWGLPPLPHLDVCAGRDILAEAVAAGREQGVRTDAWVVYLHHDAADLTATSGRVVNAFGDVNPLGLCPSSPDTSAYAAALTAEVCDRRPDGILAEALHQQPTVHGFHHERSFVALGGLARLLLLSLCFCEHCIIAAERNRLDVVAVRAWVRAVVDGPTSAAPLPARHELADLAAGHADAATVNGFLELRRDAIRALQLACAEIAAAAGLDFVTFDPSEVLAEPDSTAPAEAASWQLGLDAASIGAANVAPAFYVPSVAALREQLERVVGEVGSAPAGAILRVVGDDLCSGADLADAVRLLHAVGVQWFGYYHYGLAPSARLADIAPAHSALITS
jgi:hypothetical protein